MQARVGIFMAMILPLACMACPAYAAESKKSPWPSQVRDVKYKSEADNTLQPAMFYAPDTAKKKPLLVALHTWSGNYRQGGGAGYARWCIKKGWAFIHPDFRGPNRRPQAMGSELVVKDILSAVKYARKKARIDERRIYLIGGSGGGYAALLMAGRAPELWAGVSAWAAISDIRAWYFECRKAGRGYFKNIRNAVQGVPGQSAKADEECKKRSALTCLKRARGVNIDIYAGIHDGHTGSVPVSHSLRAFNELAVSKDRFADKDIAFMVERQEAPESLRFTGKETVAGRKIYVRRVSGHARITIFEGSHTILHNPGLLWLENQTKGEPPVWKAIGKKMHFGKDDCRIAK